MNYTWVPPKIPFLNSEHHFTVRRVYCIGRNYRAHAAEMGDRSGEPFYFCKTSDCVTPCLEPTILPYPLGTTNLHHEVELVVAVGGRGEGSPHADGRQQIAGFGVGIDFTRRDRQQEAKDQRRPWSIGKNFRHAAVVSGLRSSTDIHQFSRGAIQLAVNGEVRQQADLSQLIWPLPTILAQLAKVNHLEAGDLIFTGTPAGVSAVNPGDQIRATIAGLPPLEVAIERRNLSS